LKYLQKSIVFIYGICVLSCSADQSSEPDNPSDPENPVSEIQTKDPVPGIRIAWDYTTQTQISKANEQGYNGYARLIQLDDESLLVTYESNGNVLVKMSDDLGTSWSEPVTVATFKEGVNMAAPDLLQLENGSILLSYNPRPGETGAISKRFLIKTILSTDGGMTWENDQTVYEGDTKYENGVWEPTFLQLPSGEIQ
jgi:Neuraminidase (sialidase)